MFSLALFGGNRLDGSMVDPGEQVVLVSIFGGIELDCTAAPLPPATDALIVAMFGGVTVKLRPQQEVKLSGFSLFGGRSVAPRSQLPARAGLSGAPPALPDDDDLPLYVSAYLLFGGLNIKRSAQGAA